jgi:hypothetical protein
MLVLQKTIGIEVLAGQPRPNERAVYIRLKHPKLPTGGVMFAMAYGQASAFAKLISTVVEGDGMVEAATTVTGEEVEG